MFLVLMVVAVRVTASMITIPLEREKVTHHSSPLHGLLGSPNGTVHLDNKSGGIVYFGQLTINGQILRVMFDTGSSDLWAPNRTCVACDPNTHLPPPMPAEDPSCAPPFVPVGGDACGSHPRIDSPVDDTRAFGVGYAMGAVFGAVGSARVGIGGMEVANVPFGAINNFSFSMGLQYRISTLAVPGQPAMTWDGILGLGPSSQDSLGLYPKSDKQNLTTFLQLVSDQAVFDPVFAFDLNGISGDGSGSELTLGGVDSSRYIGDLHYVPVSDSSTWWQVSLDRVSFDGIHQSPSLAIIDSGTAKIAGPVASISPILNRLGLDAAAAAKPVNCTKFAAMPDIIFFLGTQPSSQPFAMKMQDLLIPLPTGQCILMLMAMDLPFGATQQWILGDPFMRKFYSVFDYNRKRMGFAEAKTQDSHELIV